MDVDRFEGVSWSQDEEFIAYVAEEPANSRPVFGQSASSSSGQSSSDSLEAGTWKGQGDWMEDWGESYSGKRRPVLFVANVGRYSSVRSVTKSWRYQGQNGMNEQSAFEVYVLYSRFNEIFTYGGNDTTIHQLPECINEK